MKFWCGCLLLVVSTMILNGCQDSNTQQVSDTAFYPSSKPNTRWWWFATEIKPEDVRYQLDWAKANNFGGVEIAWVYPLYRYQRMYERRYGRNYPKDTSAQKWLSKEWSDAVEYTKSYADSIGLACDFTFGSAWPVAGHNIGKEHTTQIYGDSSFRQTLTFSWAWPDTFLVIDHLDSNAFNKFADPIAEALADALEGSRSALFTDSWEIKLNSTNKIWTDGFAESFLDEMSYDIIPFMEKGIDSFPDVRYDYMLHLDKYVTKGFYEPYVRKCRQLGAWSRVQCLASPTDVMTTYSLVDIPETESMLNNPDYSRIVSSSAVLSGKKIVSSETFTCMYGFPSTYLREEQTADLKMVADAMFAQGVNLHFYHGMPYNPKGSDTIDFFATTYFGPGGSLEKDLPAFNSYMEKVSGLMQTGNTYSDVAVYVPYEDGVMKGAYPPERQRVWVWGEYEMRYVYPPDETEGHHPLWINRHFLRTSRFENGLLRVGDAAFSSLYVDVKFMDIRALHRIYQLAQQGLPICIKQSPSQPGYLKSDSYAQMMDDMLTLPNVSADFRDVVKHAPLVAGKFIPEYWGRVDDNGDLYLFLAQSRAKDLMYPVYSGQSQMDASEVYDLTFNYAGHEIPMSVEFKPYQSVMLKITSAGEVSYVDIEYDPGEPTVKPREKQRMYF